MRLRPALVVLPVLVLPVLVLLAGCAPEPATSPSPSVSSSPTSPAPTAEHTPSPTPTESTAPPQSGAEFTASELVKLCTDKTRHLAKDATYFSDMATTEWLDQPSLWFVVIPKVLDGQDSVAVCGIGGSPETPTFELEGESLPGGVAEIRDELLAGNVGGSE